ncbi:(2Fe-2S)-binding protein [Brevibacillus ruminantium]|uniref:(2Fe-2S)-binding protein n=1 Tax=Brevibacillus ruminantium TaxID=2950604 RepID=A0ABY4WC86_9BACL|nr:(2Fe-2S)-binding protein [Brevibacillus ruminantium]USG63370.1 (2Fe-2S)-binding protein [Brevibacillus ruminantium]
MYRRCNISVTVNDVERQAEIEPRMLLVHFLRETLNLTGTHIGCDTSQCGACTVLVNGEAVKSCTMLAVQADGSRITTVEGLGEPKRLHPIQQGFWEKHGLQCGFCTPGVLMAMVGLLRENASPTEAEVREALEGVICRCTGYQFIVDAVMYAASEMAKTAHAVAESHSVPIGEGE